MSKFQQRNSFVRYLAIAGGLGLVMFVAFSIRYQDNFFAKQVYVPDVVEHKTNTLNAEAPPSVTNTKVTRSKREEAGLAVVPVPPQKNVNKDLSLSLSKYEFSVGLPFEGSSPWTHKSLFSLSHVGLQIPVSPPKKTPPFKRYLPIIEVSNLEGTKTELIAAGLKTDRQVTLSLTTIRLIASQRWTGVRHYSVNVRGGIRVFDRGKTIDKVSDVKITITINSVGELVAVPIMLAFNKLNHQTPLGNWIAPKTIVPVEFGAIQVILFTSSDFGKMIPFAVGATQYGTLTSSEQISSVVNIVRDGLVVAQITKYSSIEDVRTILKTLDGAFAFVGSKNSFLYTTGASKDYLTKIDDKLSNEKKVIYFLKNDKLYPVNRSFIKNSEETASFIGQQANIFFAEKVEIIVR